MVKMEEIYLGETFTQVSPNRYRIRDHEASDGYRYLTTKEFHALRVEHLKYNFDNRLDEKTRILCKVVMQSHVTVNELREAVDFLTQGNVRQAKACLINGVLGELLLTEDMLIPDEEDPATDGVDISFD